MKKKIIFYVINFIIITNIFSLEKLPINDAGWLDYSYKEALVKDVKSFNDILSLYSDDELKKIKILDITHTKISKIEGLEKLVNLERLNISINKIEKIEGLDKLVNLKELELSSNKISKIEGLDNLINLTRLSLGDNISKIEGLDNLINLTSLALEDNISKIEGLDNLGKLKRLALGNNKIEVLENFNFLEKKGNNRIQLMLSYNPLKRIDKKTFDLFKKLNFFKDEERKYRVIESEIQLKSNYGVNSKNIKNLSKNDILYDVPGTRTYAGKLEDNIQNKKGHWIQVITEDLQIGWCFDGFLTIIEDKNFTPSVKTLRFRESPDLNGKFIRTLTQGEILELIETGKSETVNGVKGNWVKVKTEKGEIGWCFDAYLEEVKADEVKKN